MDKYNIEEEKDVVDGIIETLEQNTGDKVFTMKVLDRADENNLDVIVVFESKSILKAMISVDNIDGKIACRIKGNYI